MRFFVFTEDKIYYFLFNSNQLTMTLCFISIFSKIKTNPLLIFRMQNATLGKGSQGEVRKALHIKTKEMRAVKIIDKDLLGKHNWKFIQNEIEILSSLDHPNIVKIYEYFETKQFFYIVMELIKGKPLFRQISKLRGNEKVISKIIFELLLALNYLHKRRIVHLDLKSENILWCQGEIKIIDFGMSAHSKKKKKMKKLLGTCAYVAPEVIQENYSIECDIWSAGVVLFVLLTGKLPFEGDNETEMFQNILNRKFKIRIQDLSSVSEHAKDLTQAMMTFDPTQRPSAEVLLRHEFFKSNSDNEKCLSQDKSFAIQEVVEVINRLPNYKICSKLQERVFFYFLNNMVGHTELKAVRATFKYLDINGDGVLSFSELSFGLSQIHKNLNDQQLDKLFDLIDVNSDGTISYTEFAAAALDKSILKDSQRAKSLFKIIQKKQDSGVGVDEFQELLGNLQNFSQSDISKGLQKFDLNQDGKLDFQEFHSMMTALEKNNHQPNKKNAKSKKQKHGNKAKSKVRPSKREIFQSSVKFATGLSRKNTNPSNKNQKNKQKTKNNLNHKQNTKSSNKNSRVRKPKIKKVTSCQNVRLGNNRIEF